MTAFGTSNICWVPEGQPLRFIDLHRWVEWRMEVHQWRATLHREMMPALHQRADRWIHENRVQVEGDLDLEAAFDQGHEALGRLETLLAPSPSGLLEMALPQGPLAAAWVRVSDMPLESFHDEDYEPGAEGTLEVARLPIDGTLAFPAIRMEIPLLAEGQPGFALSVPSLDCVGEYPLPADEFPPILDEYCGLMGNSNQGKMVNLDIQGRIARESPVAIPLSRTADSDLFATLYFQFQTPGGAAVSMPLRPSQTIRVEESLRQEGFEVVRRVERNAIWRRGADWVQTLWDLPGSEAEGVPALPPLLAVPRAAGSAQPANREALLGNLLRAALGDASQRSA